MARDPHAIKIPIGMTDWVILFGNPDGHAFRRAVLRSMAGNVRRTFSGRSGLWRNT